MTGQAQLALKRLGDIAVFNGSRWSGAATAAARFQAKAGKTAATVEASLKSAQIGNIGAREITLAGNVTDLFGKPAIDAAFTGHGIGAHRVSGDVEGHATGPLEKLAVKLTSRLTDESGAAAQLSAAGLLDAPGEHLALMTLTGIWRGLALNLQAPAMLDFSDGLSLDHLIAQFAGGEITAGGRLLPQLAFNADAKDIALENFSAFLPQEGVQGTLSAHAVMNGTFAAPRGTIAVNGRALRAASAGRGLPALSLDAHALLHGGSATVTAALTAGAFARLELRGEMPLDSGHALALMAQGHADLVLLDPFVAAAGRRLRGVLALDGTIAGTLAAPRIDGKGSLSAGEVQDYANGIRIQDISVNFEVQNSRLFVRDMTGQAGTGTLTGSGSIDFAAPGMPVDFALHANIARPVVSDLLTATFSGDTKLSGTLDNPLLSGAVQVIRGEIDLPEHFPPEIAVLNVRRRGRPPPRPPAHSHVRFDVRIRTNGPIFVRGQGMDAEMGGEIHLGGSSDAPNIGGSFEMNRGSYSFAGQSLDFTSGRITFDGNGLRGRLDPRLDFVAQSVANGVTAILNVGGYASAPKITLSSTPQLPQDEVVAQLLFRQSIKQLSPLQLAGIAQGLAALGGIGGGFNPLATLRRTVGLDRLAVGSTNGGATGTETQTTVEAGRYVTRNVYVGVKQNLSGGTQTQVQVDLTRHLKAQATVSANTSPAVTNSSALNDTGSSVGLSYQFEY
jgi:translocation and assembly module TamB